MSEQQKIRNYKCLNSFTLKLIAILCMTIDHIGAVVGTKYVDGNVYLSGILKADVYWILRDIGRIAFPIFCYLIVEGYYHTRNAWRYVLRLFIFALISQIPFSLAIYKAPFSFSSLNVFFTLCMGLICVILLDSYRNHIIQEKHTASEYRPMSVQTALIFICIIGITALSVLLNTDYSIFGILLILVFYIFRDKPVKILIAMLICIFLFENPRELFALISIIPIALHNGKKGPSIKYTFYMYYPLHLTILYLIYRSII
ncbi:MAG: conjugal transfer protein TraX [Clostridium sp.]|nr:conjugal transfer protein TraX [Clostridium sp.]